MKALVRKTFPKAYGAAAAVRTSVVRALERRPDYDQDGMRLYGKSMDWFRDRKFFAAYQAGMNTGHHICRRRGSNEDIHNEYRVYLCVWAAQHGAKLEGDFVECGVNTGITSVAICTYLDWEKIGKRFYLFDTYEGIPEEQMSDEERPARIAENASHYGDDCYELACRNFKQWPSCALVKGRVPETLLRHRIDKVAYLHIDMNIAAPEVAAIEHFWPRLVRGAIVMLDDYGFEQYRPQKVAMDEWAARAGVVIATLPTGQGMVVKP